MDNFKINSSSINHIQNHDLDFIKAMNGIFAVLDGISRASSCRIVAKKLLLLTNDKYHELESAIGAMEKLGPQAQKVFIEELSKKLNLKKEGGIDVPDSDLKDIPAIKKALQEHLKYQINSTAEIQAGLAIAKAKEQYGKIDGVVNVLVDEFKKVDDTLDTQATLTSLGNLEAILSAAVAVLEDPSKGTEVRAMATKKADSQQADIQQTITKLSRAIEQEKQKIDQGIKQQDQLKNGLELRLRKLKTEAAEAQVTLSKHRGDLNKKISDRADLNRELSQLQKLQDSPTTRQNIQLKEQAVAQLQLEMADLSDLLRQAQTAVAAKETAVAQKSNELKGATQRGDLLATQLHKINTLQLNPLKINNSKDNLTENLTVVQKMREAAHTLDEVERVLAVNNYQTVQDLALEVHASLPIFSIKDSDKQQQILTNINQELDLDRSGNQVDSVRMNAAEKVVDDVFIKLQDRLKLEELQPIEQEQIDALKEDINREAADQQEQIKNRLVRAIQDYIRDMAKVSDLSGAESCEEKHKPAIQDYINDPEGPTDNTLQEIAKALLQDQSDESIKQLKLEEILSALSRSLQTSSKFLSIASKQTFNEFIGDIASNCKNQINDANQLVNEIQQTIVQVEALKAAAQFGEPKATDSLTTMSNDIVHTMQQFVGRLNTRVISSGSQSFF